MSAGEIPNVSQEERILNLLLESWPGWVSALALSKLSLQYSARVFALRRKGWRIENKVETRNGVKHGSFRLAHLNNQSVENNQSSSFPESSGNDTVTPPVTLFEFALEHRDDG